MDDEYDICNDKTRKACKSLSVSYISIMTCTIMKFFFNFQSQQGQGKCLFVSGHATVLSDQNHFYHLVYQFFFSKKK